MKCNKCNNEIPSDSKFCPICRNKIEKIEEKKKIKENVYEEKKTILISFKKAILGILGILIMILIILAVVFFKKINNNINKPIAIKNEQNTELYERNQIGLFKGPNVLEEKYNNKGDLIYCKYKQGHEIKEDSYNYHYDSKERTTKITLNGDESSFSINYNNENKISEINIGYELGTMKYIFHYNDDLIIAEKYNTISMSSYSVNNKYNGLVMISEKEIDGKTYILVTETDETDIVKTEKLYEKSNKASTNSFQSFGFVPWAYISFLSSQKPINMIISFSGFTTSYLPVFNPERILLDITESNTTNYEYDSKGRILLDSSNNVKFYYKYEPIDEKSYYCYCLCDGGVGDSYKALRMDSQYETEKFKFYLDSKGNVYRYESIDNKILSIDEFSRLKQEYMKYIEENKKDISKVKSEFSELTNTDIQNIINKTSNESYIDDNSIQDNYTTSKSANQKEEAKESANNNSSNNNVKNNNRQESTKTNSYEQEKVKTNTSQEVKKDTSFKMTSIQVTSSLTSNTEYYTLRGKVNLKVGKDADWSKYSNFTTTINGQKVSSSGDTIDDGYMSFYESYNPLNEGENIFNIIVTDADGKTISKSITVTYISEEN